VIAYNNMLRQTYMQHGITEVVKPSSESTKRRTVHLKEDVFTLLVKYVSEQGGTKEQAVRTAVIDLVTEKRKQFLKMYAPHLTLDHATQNTILINDSELKKMAVVKVTWNNIATSKHRPLLTLQCELCNSDSCIHIRYSLVLPDIFRIEKAGKLV
jgi:hypothetical protein